VRNVRVIPIPNAMNRACLVWKWNNYQTHMRVRDWLKTLKSYECN